MNLDIFIAIIYHRIYWFKMNKTHSRLKSTESFKEVTTYNIIFTYFSWFLKNKCSYITMLKFNLYLEKGYNLWPKPYICIYLQFPRGKYIMYVAFKGIHPCYTSSHYFISAFIVSTHQNTSIPKYSNIHTEMIKVFKISRVFEAANSRSSE